MQKYNFRISQECVKINQSVSVNNESLKSFKTVSTKRRGHVHAIILESAILTRPHISAFLVNLISLFCINMIEMYLRTLQNYAFLHINLALCT